MMKDSMMKERPTSYGNTRELHHHRGYQTIWLKVVYESIHRYIRLHQASHPLPINTQHMPEIACIHHMTSTKVRRTCGVGAAMINPERR